MSNNRIAVIGAGAAGLAAVSYLLAEGLQVTLFEERNEAGGVWTGTDRATHPNPIYDGLETNVPHTMMTFTDHKWPTHTPIFPPGDMVKLYLQSYATKIRYSPHSQNLTVRLNAKVCRLRHLAENRTMKWKIDCSVDDVAQPTESFDRVVVAVGNYDDPYMPKPEPGRQLWERNHPGTILHAQEYQNSTMFRNKTVIVVGNQASGWDISGHVAKVARQVVVSVRRPQTVNEGCILAGVITRFNPTTRTVHFDCGNQISDVDYIVYCTGYRYNFDFAMRISQPLFRPGFKVNNVYKHIFYIQEPTLAFIGLPKMTAAFTVAEAQSAVVARTFSGRLILPAETTMKEWEENFSFSHREQMRSDSSFHTLAQNENKDREYVNMLHEWATSSGRLRPVHGKLPPYWCRCLDNARRVAGAIRTEFKSHGLPDRYQYTTYHSLGQELKIPCGSRHIPAQDAAACFLDKSTTCDGGPLCSLYARR